MTEISGWCSHCGQYTEGLYLYNASGLNHFRCFICYQKGGKVYSPDIPSVSLPIDSPNVKEEIKIPSSLKPVLSSKRMDWETDPLLFTSLNQMFHFDLDAAASKENALCEKYYTEKEDTLCQVWHQDGQRIFLNPPYGRNIHKWMKKVCEESPFCEVIVCLIAARPDTSWWWNFVLKASEVWFLKGRWQSKGSSFNCPFPSAVVIYTPDQSSTVFKWWDWKKNLFYEASRID